MNNKNNILNELKALSPVLAGIEKVNIFSVPHGYFENLSDKIARYTREQVVQNIDKRPVNEIPPDYFNNLAGDILNKIINQQKDNAIAEIKTLSPVLYSLQAINVFKVPVGYFDTLGNKILNKLQLQPTARVIDIKKYKSFFKYAVAAFFTGVIALGAFKFIQTDTNTSSALPQYVLEGKKIQNIDKELAEVDERDIVKYLQANGQDIDISLLANTIDDMDLPSEEDYLLNENTLDNYLLDSIDENSFKN